MDNSTHGPLLAVLWESIPDPHYEEHLRRIFAILLESPQTKLDGNDFPPQNDSVQRQADLSE